MEISLKIVKEEDWDFVLDLRNEKDFRKYFQNQKHIEKNEHYEYLNKQKNNPNFFNWIICDNSDDVGYVRILDNDVSIMIKPSHHGKGIGTDAMRLVEIEAQKLGIKYLIGKMMVFNKKSEKIFVNNGFELKMYWYEKQMSPTK
jgi:RimJ/RimL family protein N-acetyltransferase|tara:strand:- start:634 stop:1065 length:432 start_codon:yes stop_codon:yes gene_type:complete